MIRIRCVVERITYQNPENGYYAVKHLTVDKRNTMLRERLQGKLDATISSMQPCTA